MSLNWLGALTTRQTICRGLSRDARRDAGTPAGQATGRGVPAGRGAFTTRFFAWIAAATLLALALFTLTLAPRTAHAHGGLSLGLRIQQEFYKPLVPVARNFKTCFKTDPATGVQVMSFCTEAPRTETPSVAQTTPINAAPNKTPQTRPARVPAGSGAAAPVISPIRTPAPERGSTVLPAKAPTSIRGRISPYGTPEKSNPVRRLPHQG